MKSNNYKGMIKNVGADMTVVLIIDLEGFITNSSQAAVSLFGFSNSQVGCLNLVDITVPAGLDKHVKNLRNLLDNKLEFIQYGNSLIDSKGEVLSVMITALPSRGSDGIINGIVCNIDRVSDAKSTCSCKKKESNLAQQYLDVVGVIMIALDIHGKVCSVNRKGCQVLGYSEEEIIGKDWFDNFLFVDNVEFVKEVFAQLMASNLNSTEYVENDIKTADGAKRTIAWHNAPLYDDSGRLCGSLSSGNDVTEQNFAKKALRESEAKFRTLYQSVHAGVLVQSVNGRIKHCNYIACNIFGMTESQVTSKTSLDADWNMINEDGTPVSGEQHPSMVTLKSGKPIFNAVRGIFSGQPDKFRWLLINTLPVFHQDTSEIKEVIITFNDITGLKYAENAVRENEAQLSSILRASPMGIGLIIDRVFKQINDSFCNMLGYSPEELLHQDSRLIYPSDEEYNRVGAVKYEQIKRLGRGTVESKFRRKDGKIIDVVLGSIPVDPNDITQGITFTVLDITDRKQAEIRLKAKERFESIIMEISADMINLATGTADAKINNALAKLGEFIKADRCYIFQFWENRERADNTYEWCREGITSYIDELKDIPIDYFSVISDYILKKKIYNISDLDQIPEHAGTDRAEFEKEGIESIVCVPMIFQDTVIGFMGFDSVGKQRTWSDDTISLLKIAGDIFAGVFERLKSEKMLRKSEHRYHELFNSVMEGIAIIDENEYVRYCNPAFARIFEKESAPEFIGKCLYDYVSDNNKHIIEQQVSRRREGLSSKYELAIEPLPGLAKTVLIASSPKFDESGKYIGSFSAVIDISETRQLQEIAERAKRLETAGQIAGQVAHDFNNLLGPLIAYPDFFRSELEEDHALIPLVNDMETAAEQIASINQQLLTLGRRGHYEQEPLNINAVIEAVLNQIDPEIGDAKIETNLADNIMNVMGGQSQINRVIANLLFNSLDATDKCGSISIKSENFYADTIAGKFGRVPRGEYVKVSVCDDGCGISDDILLKIFDPFFTTKTTDRKRGSGLGLSVVDAVVKDHMGFIDLESTLDNGTCFYLYFPITREEIVEIEFTDEISGGDEKILVIDDDRMQQEVTCILLNKLGYQVSAVDSGEKAIKKLKDQQFDLLVLDMIMPPGIDGAETYRQALKINPDQKAIIVSGYSESDQVKKAISMGAGAYIKKPLTLKSIGMAVHIEKNKVKKTTK